MTLPEQVITTEPVWSVILVLAIGLAGTLYCVYTILKISLDEMSKQSALALKIMLAFLLPLASKVVDAAIAKIPDDAELGEKLIEICLHILGKAVKLTKTDADDQLLEAVAKAIRNREDG